MMSVLKFWRDFLLMPEVSDFWRFVVGLIFFVVIGAGMGSFVCCQVRRMRLLEEGKKVKSKRSVCLGCGYQLKWHDNIPIVSWLVLRGRCRKCGAKIGAMEIISELLAGVVFGVLYWLCYEKDVYTVIFGVGLAIFWLVLMGLALYDGKWKVVPNKMLALLIILGFVLAAIRMMSVFLKDFQAWILQVGLLIMAVSILAGI